MPTDFSAFSERQGRVHRGDAERRQRAHAYVHHSLAIKRHNLRAGRSFTMTENRYTDWLEPEFSQLLGFKRHPEATAAVSAVMRGEPDPAGGPRTKFECAAPACRCGLSWPHVAMLLPDSVLAAVVTGRRVVPKAIHTDASSLRRMWC